MELKDFDKLIKRDFENGAILEEIRSVFKERDSFREREWKKECTCVDEVGQCSYCQEMKYGVQKGDNKIPDYIVTFGKYSGQDISMVPRGYLIWVQENLIEDENSWMKQVEKDEMEEAIEIEFAQRDRSHSNF